MKLPNIVFFCSIADFIYKTVLVYLEVYNCAIKLLASFPALRKIVALWISPCFVCPSISALEPADQFSQNLLTLCMPLLLHCVISYNQ